MAPNGDHLDRLLAPDTTMPWYRSILPNIAECVHPEKLPPLELTSKPVPVSQVWGLYGPKKQSAVMSVAIHAGIFCLLWFVTTSPPAIQMARQFTMLIAPPPVTSAPPAVEVAKNPGGAPSKSGPSSYTPPKPIMRHYTPPPATNLPPLAAVPQLLIPPEWVGTTDPTAHFGNPLDGLLGAAGNFGTGMGMGGSGSGTGTGSGGFGSGRGAGSGNGTGGGTSPAAAIYTAAKGMTPPEPIFSPDAEYSEEARIAKLSGKVVLSVVVETDGTISNIAVTKALGMGLEEKAEEAVAQWKFRPATIAGKPVRARVNVEVVFRLLTS